MTKFCRERQSARFADMIEQMQRLRQRKESAGREREVELLIQLQQEAVTAGTALEADQGKSRLLVAELERFCELVYQISIELEESEQVNKLAGEAESILSRLKEALAAVKPRKEVAFLPYQVSMWDSLESVWLAAQEDTETDSYVVPIPYYDVLPDNGLGILHDQAAQYPDYVPVFSYQAYPLKERHPDVIFFHNPYDGCNTVTRVPEQFYASQLRKYTEQLVYIPYFASQDPGPSEHQCYMPGVLFADKVVVQPGAICETYHRVYTQQLKENGWEGKLTSAGEKFLPLGSPKFDKILNMECRMEDLPESWQSVIQKPDGGRKKIILYNLTINTFLVNSELELEKVCRVFELFQQKRDEAVLLWRPHPLLLSAINTLRPHLKEVYQLLVQQCREGGWGIYDQTPDPNLAMALSDAYYGDWSSLLVTYRVTEKPIMIQNMAGREEEEFLAEILNSQTLPTEQGKKALKAESQEDNLRMNASQKRNQRAKESIGSCVYQKVMETACREKR